MSAVRETVVKVIADHLGLNAAEIIDSERLDEDLGADDLDPVEIVMFLEEEFDIEISDEEAEPADTVGKLVALVERLVAK